VLNAEIEANTLIDASIEELLAKEDVDESESEKTDTGITVDDNETKELDEASDLLGELLPETNIMDLTDDLHSEPSVSQTDQEDKPESSLGDEISFEKLFEGGSILEDDDSSKRDNELSENEETDSLSAGPSEERSEPLVQEFEVDQEGNNKYEQEEINLDFLNEGEEKQISSIDEEEIEENLTATSVQELLAEDLSVEANHDSNNTADEFITDADVGDSKEEDEDNVSFADLIHTVEDEFAAISQESEDGKDTDVPQIDDTNEAEKEKVISKDKHELDDKERLLKNGIKYYKSKDYDRAIKEFRRIIETYPDFKEAHAILGNAYFRNKMFSEAAMAYEKVKQMDPEDITAYENMGVIYANQRDYKQAIREWKKVLDLNPERTDIEKKIEKALRNL
jgi:tetratricopeptide (TPR) repeat protein